MVYVDGHVHHSYSSTVTQKKACKIELEKRASNIFFIKMEYVLANLEGSNFKNFLGPSAPTMAALDTTILN